MEANKKFATKNKPFWALVRTVSQAVGYTKNKQVKTLTQEDITAAFNDLNLDISKIYLTTQNLTPLGKDLFDYFEYRADVLNNYVEPRLMDAESAKNEYESLQKKHCPKCPIPMNKQKGEKKAPAYFTAIVNIILESKLNGEKCSYDPRELTTATSNGLPLRTLSRRVDGAYPSPKNPKAIWEIKEYYYTTTFGSRVADGVYETLLDGMEIEELYENEKIDIKHYLMVDAYFTWWTQGKSYLCRIIDMLNMGYIDEVLFGREVVERWPLIIESWME